ncbi:hypothetical protein K439DRAFT_1642931 [Ramaria rubella]|nr:hypothetical protein K439DRAFT_1642931 [Ramaria rubella]
MATTAVQARTTSIVVPSIHLGSFSPYPSMPQDMKPSLRFSEDSVVPVFRDEKASQFPQQRSPQWRSNNTSYPDPQPYAYPYLPPSRSSYAGSPPATALRTPPSGSGLVSSKSPALPVQPPNSPAQLPGPPREVCVECMMRDEDMADVDVTGPGVWDRESDVWYIELCQREEEEDREHSNHPSSSSGVSSSASHSRPRARGLKLTEKNLTVWLSLNPREPAAKQQTLRVYLDAQNSLLMAETQARMQATQESRQLDDKMRDAYSELRRSAYDLGASASALDDGGVKIRSPGTSGYGDDARSPHKRDTTLLENGMIVERVDVRKEESRMRKEERRARKASRDSLGVLDARDRERDVTSLYSYQAAEGPASLRSPAPYDSSMSVTLPANRSVRSMYNTPSKSWQQPPPNRPMSMAPGSMAGLGSQTSLDLTASPRRRFFGGRQWSGYFGSNSSLVPSGSMIDMHIGLDQEKYLSHTPHVDLGSNAPSLREAWPRIEDGGASDRPAATSSSTTVKKKKRRAISKLWKIITGAPNKELNRVVPDPRPPHEEEEEDLPLAPPPPLSYLVNRSSSQSERSMGPGRHVSMPSLTSNGVHHPRSSSAPNGTGVCLSSPSDQSSALPSPTEVRFPYRDSSGDEPEDGLYDDDPEAGSKKKAGGLSPSRPYIVNISEPDFRTTSPTSMSIPTPPSVTRNGPSSSSLAPTIKLPLIRPLSALSLDKSLPPLPPGEHEWPASSPLPERPRGLAMQPATLPMTAYPNQTFRGLAVPNSGFRFEDAARRQSFNGLASRPALPLPRGAGPGTTPGSRYDAYDDFGASRHSFAVFEQVPHTTTKRKNRFGFGALLGLKEKNGGEHRREGSAATMPGPRSMNYDGYPGHLGAPSLSDRSSSQQGMSMSSRRALDELVPQEPDFVAYRYPSRDERLDLSRG